MNTALRTASRHARNWPHAEHWMRSDQGQAFAGPGRAFTGQAPAFSAHAHAFAEQAPASTSAGHPLADPAISLALKRRAEEIDARFAGLEPALRRLASRQFDDGFSAWAQQELRTVFDLELPAEALAASWARPLDAARLYARCVLGSFRRLVEREFDRSHATLSDGDDAHALIRRWGYHAIDITPCADGRLSGVIDYILRVPPSVIAYRKSYAGAMFAVEESLQQWETIELRRWREGLPNSADESSRYLKIGVYHFSSADPTHEGCAAHGSDAGLAAGALLERLNQFAAAVEQTHCCGASVATLLIGVDTDTDAIRIHVPDAADCMRADRYVDNLELYERTRALAREEAKQHIRAAVAACCGVDPDHGATEGMRWFIGYLLKNNIAQVDAVRHWHGGRYVDGGHTERLIIVGDAIDDVQLRNLAFQAQMDTVEEGAADLDIGVKILRGIYEPRSLAVPLLVHMRYDERIPGARQRAEHRALRLQTAIENRFPDLVSRGGLLVQSVVRNGMGAALAEVSR